VDKRQRGKFRHLSTGCPPIWWAFLLAKYPVNDATATTAASKRSGFFMPRKSLRKSLASPYLDICLSSARSQAF
jgi:hypothetical protein